MYLRTFGTLQLEGSDFRSEQPLLLLAYLVDRVRVSRMELMELFWPFQSNRTRRVKSLSDCLNRLSRAGVEILRDGPMLSCTLNSDFLELEASYQAGDYQAVVDLYQGTFLDNIEANKRWQLGEDLENWLNLHRESYQSKFITAVFKLLETHLAQHCYEMMLPLLRRLLTLPQGIRPFSSLELNRLSMLLEAAGIRDFEAQIRRLQDELTLPSSDDMIGRQDISAELLKTVLAKRKVLIFGFAGVGKTCLLEHLSWHLERFFEAVYVVRLGQLHHTATLAEVLGTLARQLGVHAATAPLLFHHLGQRRILLVLDDLELGQLEAFWQDLLMACPRLHILASSRSRLPGFEGSFEILPLPEAEALKLLTLEQRRLGLAQHTDRDMKMLLEALGYLPLAIKLMVPWLKVLPLPEILLRLKRDLSLLKDGQVSLQQLIDRSVTLLMPEEQMLFRQLSVFEGGFDFAALTKILSVKQTSLRQLIESSLLGFSAETQRYFFHPLVQVYLKGQPGPATQAHADYYLAQLNSKITRQRLMADLANLEKAWRFQLATAAEKLLAYLNKLRLLADEHSIPSYSLKLGMAVYERFPQDPRALLFMAWLKLRVGEYGEVKSYAEAAYVRTAALDDKLSALNAQGAALDLAADYRRAQHYFTRVLELTDCPKEGCSATLNLVVSLLNQGALDDAERYLEQVSSCENLRKDYLKARLSLLKGYREAARMAFERLLLKTKEQQQLYLYFQCVPRLIHCLLCLGEHEQALALATSSLAESRRLALFRSELMLQSSLAECRLAVGDFSEAFQSLLAALKLARLTGYTLGLRSLFVRLLTTHCLEPELSAQVFAYCQDRCQLLLFEDRQILHTLKAIQASKGSDAILHLNEIELAEVILLRYAA